MPAEDWIRFDDQAFDTFLANEAKEREADLTSISLDDFASGDDAAGLVDLIRSAICERAILLEGRQQLEFEATSPHEVDIDLGAYGRYSRTLNEVFQASADRAGPEALKAAARYVSHLIGSGHANDS